MKSQLSNYRLIIWALQTTNLMSGNVIAAGIQYPNRSEINALTQIIGYTNPWMTTTLTKSSAIKSPDYRPSNTAEYLELYWSNKKRM